MRIFVLTLLGASALMAAGCSTSRSLSRSAVMADHIASTTPSGRTVSTVAAPSRRVATTTRYMPAPPPPPALPSVARPVARATYPGAIARPVSRPAAPIRTAPSRVAVPRRAAAPRRRAAPAKPKSFVSSDCST